MNLKTLAIKKNTWIYVAIIVLLLYLLPFLVLWQDSPILIHDTLDAWVVDNKVLIESGQIFSGLDSIVPQMMNGLPRNVFASELNFFLWMQTSFGLFTAYIINIALMHFIAFIGMFLLLRKHVFKEKEQELFAIGVALCFSLLPFNSYRILGIAGQPILLYVLLNIRAGQARWKEWLLVLVAPFFCNFTHVGIFFISGIGLLWLYDFAKARKPNYPLLLAIISLAFVSALVEYRLIYHMFFDSLYVSHRTEFIGYPTDFINVLGRGARTFIFGSYHAISLHHIFIFAAAAIALATAYLKKVKSKLLLQLILILVAISLLTELINGWSALLPLKEQVSLLKTFNFTRFTSFFPLLWYVVFALSLKTIFEKAKYGKHIALVLIVLQAGFLFSYSDRLVQPGGLGLVLSEEPSFEEFFSESLFQEIEDFIGEPQDSYRVVSIGLHPSISLYNGFYTLDGYHANYPLEYKHEFRELIEKELEKSPGHLQRYFDSTGGASRAYIWAAELNGEYNCVKYSCPNIKNLEFNTEKFKELGGKYVLSAVEIVNAEENNLRLMHVFESRDSAWIIWLYKV